MAKINKIFKVDAWMIPVFLGVVATGIGVHISGERGTHDQWHAWAVAHVVLCVVFLVLAYMHISQHWGWFKTLFKGTTRGRGVTITLSVVFTLEVLSGIILLVFVDGEDSWWGHFHWIVGILLAGFGIGHFAKRWPRLRKGLNPTPRR